MTRYRERHIHRLGNPTLVVPPFNPALSNGSWTDKLSELSKQSKLALDAGFADLGTWDEAAITNRARSLAEAACQVRPRPAVAHPAGQ